jgi:type II secretory pathway pseudopilin PulG
MKPKGFGLTELLINLAIIMILVTGIAELLVFSLSAQRKAEAHIKIQNLITTKLEQIKTRDFESDELREGDSSEILGDVDTKEVFHRETRVRDAGPDLKGIEVSVFSEIRPGQGAQLTLFLSRELGF